MLGSEGESGSGESESESGYDESESGSGVWQRVVRRMEMGWSVLECARKMTWH